jgi:AcrR family transcriptional regulator
MSDPIRYDAAAGDRRVRRTRAALNAAFSRLVLSKGYERFTAADIARGADVGRSTFYEHYQGKDDILAQSLVPVLTPLAESCCEGAPSPRLALAVDHFWKVRTRARALLTGRARDVATRLLARLIEDRLAAAHDTRGEAGLPRALVAAQIASGQLAMLDEWLTGRHRCSAAQIAAALQGGAHAVAEALLK